MRITTKIMQNNSLTNLNNNKILQDQLATQIETESKITRPSDDPVIAIRALRLRTNLSEVTQYLDKNTKDAEGWIDSTVTALSTVSDVLESIRKQCEKGNDGSLTSENRAAILEQLKGLRDEIYETGDAEFGGRYLFTGYRTNETLRFQKADQDDPYVITENFKGSSIDTITYVNTGTLTDITTTNYNAGGQTTEQDVSSSSIARIRLAYDTLNSTVAPTLTLSNSLNSGTNTVSITATAGGTTANVVTGAGVDGIPNTADDVTTAVTFKTVSLSSDPDPYEQMTSVNASETAGTATAIYIPETGEILISNNMNKLVQSDSSTALSAEYGKKTWEEGDLRPEHYFKCTEELDSGAIVSYSGEEQYMSYDVGYNQSIQINTLASEVFTHDIGRTVDELMQASQDVVDIEKTISTLKAMQGDSNYDQDEVTARLEAANKAKTYLAAKEQKLYASAETKVDGFIDQANLATTNAGNRGSRLDLTTTRLTAQKTNFKGLVTENEGADVAELAVQLKSAQTAYDAALLATSKIVQNSLMNYI